MKTGLKLMNKLQMSIKSFERPSEILFLKNTIEMEIKSSFLEGKYKNKRCGSRLLNTDGTTDV